jgi:hypothetical protein
MAAVLLCVAPAACLHYIRHMCDWQHRTLRTAGELQDLGYIKLPVGAAIVDARYRHSACHGSVTMARVRLDDGGLTEFRRLNSFSGEPVSGVVTIEELLRASAPVEFRDVYKLKVEEGWTAEITYPTLGYVAAPQTGRAVDLYVFSIH